MVLLGIGLNSFCHWALVIRLVIGEFGNGLGVKNSLEQ